MFDGCWSCMIILFLVFLFKKNRNDFAYHVTGSIIVNINIVKQHKHSFLHWEEGAGLPLYWKARVPLSVIWKGTVLLLLFHWWYSCFLWQKHDCPCMNCGRVIANCSQRPFTRPCCIALFRKNAATETLPHEHKRRLATEVYSYSQNKYIHSCGYANQRKKPEKKKQIFH